MKKIIVLLAIVIVAGIVISCRENTVSGKGPAKVQERQISNFTGIRIEAPVKAVVKIVPNSVPSLRLDGQENILAKIKTEVKDGVLRIYTDSRINFTSNRNVTAYMTMPVLNDLDIAGMADAEINGTVKTDKLQVNITGAGDVRIADMAVNTFITRVSGAGDLDIKGGIANRIDYTVSGAGDIESFHLQSKDANVSISGMGDVNISVSDNLSAKVTGAGDIKYKGNPKVSSHITGGGAVAQAR